MNEPIFISFATDDRKVAETILTALEKRGLSCWIATRNISPGENFQEAITRAIRSAKVMILVFSANSNNSLEVKKEIALAGRYNVIVVPVRVEDVVPSDALTYELAVRQWIDMFDDWEHAIERLIGQLTVVFQAEPTGASVMAAATVAQPGPSPRRALTLFLAGGLAVLVIGGGLAWKFWPVRHSAAPKTQVAQVPQAPALADAKPAAQGPPAAATPTPPPQPAPPAAASVPAPAPAVPAGRTASAASGSTFRACPNCPEMVVIPAGHYQMGAGPAELAQFAVPSATVEHEQPQHEVTIAKPFALAKYDVTRAEFATFARATNFHPTPGCQVGTGGGWRPRPEGSWEDPGIPQTDRDPVVCMNAAEIEAYLEWLRQITGKAYRLPSEAEWEYAARAGTTTSFYWGDDPSQICAFENVGDETAQERGVTTGAIPCRDGFAESAPVGSFKPNPWGLYDMLGNVFVQVEDCWNDTYVGAPVDGSAWLIGNCGQRVMRKASFGNVRAVTVRSANRFSRGAVIRLNRSGFRVALTLP